MGFARNLLKGDPSAMHFLPSRKLILNRMFEFALGDNIAANIGCNQNTILTSVTVRVYT